LGWDRLNVGCLGEGGFGFGIVGMRFYFKGEEILLFGKLRMSFI
jgi:hypothetical protein